MQVLDISAVILVPYVPLLCKHGTAWFLKNKPNYTPVGLKGLGAWLVFRYGDNTLQGSVPQSEYSLPFISITPRSLESISKECPVNHFGVYEVSKQEREASIVISKQILKI